MEEETKLENVENQESSTNSTLEKSEERIALEAKLSSSVEAQEELKSVIAGLDEELISLETRERACFSGEER